MATTSLPGHRTRAWRSASTKNDVRTMGRPAYGVRGMDLAERRLHRRHGGHAQAGSRSRADGGAKRRAPRTSDAAAKAVAELILTVTENGYGKRTPVDEYRLQSRGGKGVINMKTTARNGKVVAVLLVSEESQGMVISQYGKIIRIPTDQVRRSRARDPGRAAAVAGPGRPRGRGRGDPRKGRRGERLVDSVEQLRPSLAGKPRTAASRLPSWAIFASSLREKIQEPVIPPR